VDEGTMEKITYVDSMVCNNKQQDHHVPHNNNGTQPRMLVRKYRSVEDDIEWARAGLIATMINGESIPLILRSYIFILI